MNDESLIIQKDLNQWLIRKAYSRGMRVPGTVFGDRAILEKARTEGSLQQVCNVAALPGIVGASLAMPDIHYGYGFCIGGVAAFDCDRGIVSPGGVGYDINCGVRCLTSEIECRHVDRKLLENLGAALLRDIPTGMGSRSLVCPGRNEFIHILRHGARGVVEKYCGNREDLNNIESGGRLEFDSPDSISDRAIERGIRQLGSLGSGNHFVEIQKVDKIYDPVTAKKFGLKSGHIIVLIHTGSRGLGHQVATDYIEKFRRMYLKKIAVNDPQLVCAPIHSSLGQQYLQALNGASNFAWANRHLLMEQIADLFERYFRSSRKQLGLRLLYDQAHNIAKFEEHTVKKTRRKLLVHRKGATRSFPAGHPELAPAFRETGQPVLIPGSMGTASYVLKGGTRAMAVSFGSSSHGAGRLLSRNQAVKRMRGRNVREEMRQSGVLVFSHSNRGLQEEIPQAYKDVAGVVDVSEKCGLAEKVARLLPLVVLKG